LGVDLKIHRIGQFQMANGNPSDGGAWKLGVADPRSVGEINPLVSFSVTNQAVATSDDYQQAYTADKSQHHIINPATGYSPPELASVSVLAPTATLADALSTTVMVAGIETGLQLVNQLSDVEALLVTKDRQIRVSNKFPDQRF
jgi:thiamine biosynthesis lipoprotein